MGGVVAQLVSAVGAAVGELVVAIGDGTGTGFPNASSAVPVSQGRDESSLCRPVLIALIAVLGSTRNVIPGTRPSAKSVGVIGYVIPFAIVPLDTVWK